MRLIIIGGGAAGFMAAITAAETCPDCDILILEKNRTVLNKVRISGGGRCNVTHNCLDSRKLIKNYPRGERFLKKLLPLFDVQHTIRWFESRGVTLKTEPDGRMFPSTDSSETIIRCLVQEAQRHSVAIRTSTAVSSFVWCAASDRPSYFQVKLAQSNEILEADRVLVATGGFPKRSGFDWLAEHDHLIVDPVPSLFTFHAPESPLLSLSGISVQDTQVSIVGSAFQWRGPLLLTHWGFSGPVVLKLSAWGARLLAEQNYHCTCRVNWVPVHHEEELRSLLLQMKNTTPKQLVASHAQFGLPGRLWRKFLEQIDCPEDLRWGEVPNKTINRLVNLLSNNQFQIKGKSTFKEEFVTAGGISLSEINPITLESTRIKGLYFAGEVLDVDGITGGFNFQNAWTTGFVAGQNCVK